jgi:GDP-L-fucose synthase
MGKIVVTGSNGLVGSALRRWAKTSGHHDFVFITRDEADLVTPDDFDKIIQSESPECVIHCASVVGGIGGNMAMQEKFFHDNIRMNANIIHACAELRVPRLLAFSSVCVFPDSLAVLEEDKMHEGPVFESNFAYGYAKRMVDVHIRAVKSQYGLDYCSVIPGNIFGPSDMFSIEHGHIIPSLIHKLYLAKRDNTDFRIWGDGQSYREFIYVDDLARCVLNMVDMDEVPPRLIVSGKDELPISYIVDSLVEIAGFTGSVVYETDKPNGQRRRPSSKRVFNEWFHNFEYTPIYEGLKSTWDWFCESYPNVRTEYTK